MGNHRTAVVTGSTGGIGQEIAKRLASAGWNLVLVNRNRDKTDSQLESLRGDHPEQAFQGYLCDVLDAKEISHATDQISADYPSISALYNVAGLLTDRYLKSGDNVEGHFAVNTLAPYLFVRGLRGRLADGASSGAPSVIANFSSSAIKGVKEIDFDCLIAPEKIGGLMGAYAISKMALTIATAALADELHDEGVLSFAIDPGPTKTAMTNSGDGMPWFVRLLVPILFKSADVQARLIVESVEDAVKNGTSGVMIVGGKRKAMPALASDRETQKRLVELLERLGSDRA